MLTTRDKEDLQISYISAICASASISFDLQRHDADSTDAIIKKELLLPNNQRFVSSLRIQLKCTSSQSQYTETEKIISYKLKAKNYNDLCARCTTPILLGLLVLPDDENEWVTWTEQDLIIRGRMYWAEFSGKSGTANTSTITVTINKKNIINQDTLLDILNRIAREEWP